MMLFQTPTVDIRPAGLSTKALAELKSGDRNLGLGEFAAATGSYIRAMEAAPNSLVARWSLGLALSALRRSPALAVQQYREATRIAEDDLITALLLQGALQEYGDRGAAQQVYLDTVRRFSRPGQPGLDASGSLKRIEAALKQCPNSPVLALLQGDALQIELRFQEAGLSYRRAIGSAPYWPKPKINLGLSYLAQGKANQAVLTLEGALKTDPANPRALLAMGDAQFQSGNHSGALKLYNQLSQVESVAVPAATGAARASMALGQASVAVSNLKSVQKRAPKDPTPVAALADIQMKTGSFAEAADSYASALKLSEEGGLFAARPSLQRALAEAQLSAKRPTDAQRTLQKALQEDPENEALWRRLLAQSYLEQNDRPAAEMELKRALNNERSLFPQETLQAIAAEGWTEKFIAGYQADLAGARTGVRGSSSTQTGIVVRSVPISKENEIVALAGLAHLLRFTSAVRDEVSVRRDLVHLRGSGADWFLLAQAQERLGDNADARASYGQAGRKGDLSSAIQKLAIERIRKLASLPGRREE
ncbi:tetratricopeptide repeat protein [Armatimonas sp.]|uniref:tetratricopeptide repeat protein n=1 Tax=Armatimonas sp. TaxID=1872638 RepID=UPI00374DF056